jgi:YidC/Oxa1 family membrane protein insertase
MENRRIVLAIALMLFVWSGFNILFPPAEKQQEETQNISEVKSVVSESLPSIASAPVPLALPVSEEVLKERKIKVNSNLFELVFSTNGARLIDAKLLKFKQSNTPDSPLVKIVDAQTAEFGSYGIFGGDGFYLPENSIYSFSSDVDEILLSETEKTELVFHTTTQENVSVVKIFTFYPDKYNFDIDIFVDNLTNKSKSGTLNFNIVNRWDDSKEGDSYTFVGPSTFNGEDLLTDDIEDLKEASKSYGSNTLWTSFTTKYFVNIVKPFDNSIKSLDLSYKKGSVVNTITSPSLTFDKNSKKSFRYSGYLGPKDYDLLKKTGLSFERVIDLGFFDIIAKPLKAALKFFYGYLGNYGFAIVLLTVCIKAIFWPLTQKSYSSMKDMQKLQPQMQKLRAKHGKDKQKLNQEMMALYKENRVNPFGGCLPMLVQIPVFFALYQVLLAGIELRHAPFMLWITDLSAADTLISDALGLGFALGPLPVIMGFTMFLQQKMAPTNMDPTQAKIMLFMPVFFTFIFLSFPSGLVIYWLINNLLTIVQQYLINRKPA